LERTTTCCEEGVGCCSGAQATPEVASDKTGHVQLSPEQMGHYASYEARETNDTRLDWRSSRLTEYGMAAMPIREIQKPREVACDRSHPPYTMLDPEGTPAAMMSSAL